MLEHASRWNIFALEHIRAGPIRSQSFVLEHAALDRFAVKNRHRFSCAKLCICGRRASQHKKYLGTKNYQCLQCDDYYNAFIRFILIISEALCKQMILPASGNATQGDDLSLGV